MKNIENSNTLEKKDVLLQNVIRLKKLYKKEKEELVYVDNVVDEGFIQEKIDVYVNEIRKLNLKLKDIDVV